MVACKSSIKANHPLDVESARALVKELATCENPYSCAHGRPTIVHFNGGDLEKCSDAVKKHIFPKPQVGRI